MICAWCKNESVNWCEMCGVGLCQSCSDGHRKLAMSSDHTITNEEDRNRRFVEKRLPFVDVELEERWGQYRLEYQRAKKEMDRLGAVKDSLTNMAKERDTIRDRPERSESVKKLRLLLKKLMTEEEDATEIEGNKAPPPQVSYCTFHHRFSSLNSNQILL